MGTRVHASRWEGVVLVALALMGVTARAGDSTATALRPYGEAELGVGDQFRDFAFRGADGAVTR